MKNLIALLVITSQIAFAGGEEGTGDPVTTTSNSAYKYIQVCITNGEDVSGVTVEASTTNCALVQIQAPTSE